MFLGTCALRGLACSFASSNGLPAVVRSVNTTSLSDYGPLRIFFGNQQTIILPDVLANEPGDSDPELKNLGIPKCWYPDVAGSDRACDPDVLKR